MDTALTRRTFVGLCAAAAVPAGAMDFAADGIARLEKASGGRLGVAVLDTQSGAEAGYRMDERFALCSTFKLPLAGMVLREAARGTLSLDRRIGIQQRDIVAHAPVAREHVGGTLSIRELAHAAQTTSDNAAANLLLAELGGPAGFTALIRQTGDKVTRVDRPEPAMNRVKPGDPRDTTSPRAMAATTGRLLTGDLLTADSRAVLKGWMVETRTGSRRLRAGLPKDWLAGDKTGTMNGAGEIAWLNDVAAIWPKAGRPPFIVAAYFQPAGERLAIEARDEAVLADAMRALLPWIKRML